MQHAGESCAFDLNATADLFQRFVPHPFGNFNLVHNGQYDVEVRRALQGPQQGHHVLLAGFTGKAWIGPGHEGGQVRQGVQRFGKKWKLGDVVPAHVQACKFSEGLYSAGAERLSGQLIMRDVKFGQVCELGDVNV